MKQVNINDGGYKPFGFDFSDGGTRAVWCVLCVVLFYELIRFVIGVAIDNHLWVGDPHGVITPGIRFPCRRI